MTDEWLVSKTYKQLIQRNIKKQITQLKSRQKTWIGFFSKEDIQTATALHSARLHSVSEVPNLVCSSTQAAVTNYHRRSGLNNRNFCPHSSGGLKSKVKMPLNLILVRTLFFACRQCLHMAVVSLSPYKGINPIIWAPPPWLHPNPITSQKPHLQTPTHWRLRFNLWILGVGCWRRLLRVPRTARKSNQLILKEINSEYSLEALTLKLKLQYFVCLMRRADSLEKTLMLRKIEGRRRRGRQRMRWLDSIIDSMDWVWANSGRWWRTGKPGVLKFMESQSQTQLSGWTIRSTCVWDA